MRKSIAAGNWKMNTTLDQGLDLLDELMKLHRCESNTNKEIIIFPPYTHLHPFVSKLENCCIKTGAQNMHQEEKGAFTGEVSANMIRKIGCEYVLIGHSERRQFFHETNELLVVKVKLALANDLKPVYCCGESLEEREKGGHYEIIENQIKIGLFHLSKEEFADVIIAYEPVWAIGTGKTASPEQAQEIHAFIRGLLKEKYGEQVSEATSILYGGSVKGANAKELFNQKDIDGGLVGGASLIPTDFNTIINAI
ncbi:triose-phosphate isomerase [Bacteroidota bacterium]